MTTDHIDADFVEEKGTALAVAQTTAAIAPPGLFGTDDPDLFIDKAARTAAALKKVIDSRGLAKKLNKKNPQEEYIEIGGWQLLGGMVKVYSSVEWTRKLENGWEARVIIQDALGNLLGSAEAQCTRDEWKWKERDDYALRSMAQTRAESRAYRSVLGFVVELAGYKSTPAEEMPPVEAAAPSARIPNKADLENLASIKGVDLTEFIVANVRGDYDTTNRLTNQQVLDTERLLSALESEVPL